MKRFVSLLTKMMLVLASITFTASPPAITSTIKPEVIHLNMKNTMIFDREINAGTVDNFVAALIGKEIILGNENAPLYIIIVSPGGGYETAKDMRKILTKVKNVVLICKYCASAAGYVFATYDGPRLVVKESQLMIHEMYISHFTAENVSHKEILDELIKDSAEFNEAMYTLMNMSKEDYLTKIIGKEWNLNGLEIVKWHLADKLVTISCDEYIKRLAPNTCASK